MENFYASLGRNLNYRSVSEYQSGGIVEYYHVTSFCKTDVDVSGNILQNIRTARLLTGYYSARKCSIRKLLYIYQPFWGKRLANLLAFGVIIPFLVFDQRPIHKHPE